MSDEHTLDAGSDSDSFIDGASSSDEVTMPLGMGDFEASEAIFASGADGGEKSGRSGGLMLIGAVVAMAIGGLVIMNTLSKIASAPKGDIDISHDKWNLRSRGDDGGLAILGLDTGIIDLQVPWADLQRDPFILELLSEGPDTTPDPLDLGAAARDRRLAEIDSAAARLRLQSVLGGRQPLAIINGETMRIGDVLTIANTNVTFRVVAIARGSVTIVSADPALKLNVKKVLTLLRP